MGLPEKVFHNTNVGFDFWNLKYSKYVMDNQSNLEIEKLKAEIKKIKAESAQSRIHLFSDLAKNILLIIGAIILFIVIRKPESVVNRQNSEETISRERAKLLLEVINYDKPEKVYQGFSIIKETYPNSNEWMSRIEKVIFNTAKRSISDNILEKYKQLKDDEKCLQKLMIAEMNGTKIEAPCGYTSGLIGAGMRVNEIKKLLDSKIAELRELVKLYGLDENTLPEK